MSNEKLDLASEFPEINLEQWKALVDKTLKGRSFESALVTETYDGLSIQPLYTPETASKDTLTAGLPGAHPFTRGNTTLGKIEAGWDIRQRYAHPDIKQSNETILEELERGGTSILLQIDGDAQGLEDSGIFAYSLTDFDKLLKNIYLDLAPVALAANENTIAQAAALIALFNKRGHDGSQINGNFGADPLSVLAAKGKLPGSPATALTQLADLANYTARQHPNIRSINIDTSVYHAAGASEAQDIACSMATAVTYLRALTDAGMDINTACQQISFTYSVGTDFFLSIIKLRTARRLWAQIAKASGASEQNCAMQMHVNTAYRVLSQRDPWVNILRTTISCFAAAVAGADSINVQPFDQAIGLPSDLARRVARNIQVILQEESGLAKVIDPAGGSLYIEKVGNDLAESAWKQFQTIESSGGMTAALVSGEIAESISSVQSRRATNIARRKDPLTGISEFPNIHEKSIDTDKPDTAALYQSALSRLENNSVDPALLQAVKDNKNSSTGQLTEAIVKAIELGASTIQIAETLAETATTIQAFTPHRLAAEYEKLRDATDAAAEKGARASVLLINIGTPADFTGRMTFAKNYFEAGGIEGVISDAVQTPAAAVEAFKQSDSQIAVLCSSDRVYAEQAEATATALKAAGADHLFLAGKPGDKEAAYKAAGVDSFIFAGDNMLTTLQATLTQMGVLN